MGLRPREKAAQYLPLAQGWDDKSKERAVEFFADKRRRDEFFKFFNQLQNLYEILSPDAFLRPYMKGYESLAKLYWLIRNAYHRVYADREFVKKTQMLLRGRTTLKNLEPNWVIHELGVKELIALKESDASDTTKVLNLRKILAAAVKKNAKSRPFLVSIGERAELVAQQYEDRQLTTQHALEQFEMLGRECVNAETERLNIGLDENAFAIYTMPRPVVKDVSASHAEGINAVFSRFPDFQWDERQKGELRAELYKALLPIVGSGKMIEIANSLLKLQRI